jgi:uncharacterized membrane protein
MGLRRSVLVMITAFLSFSAVLPAKNIASCTFDTFTAPSGYTLNTVQGVGDDGTVVGQLIDDNTQLAAGFLRAPSGKITVFKAPKSLDTWMYGQNATGTSAGYYLTSGKGSALHGFMLTGSNFTQVDYPKASNTQLFGVNQLRAVVGSFSAGTAIKGFLLANGKYTTIAHPNQQINYATAVNDHNAVVGYYSIGWVNYGFLWQNGKFTDINYPKAKFGTSLYGINNSGVIVGNHISADNTYGFIYQNSTFKNIVYSGSKYATAGGINNNGVVSGLIFYTGGKTLGYTAVCK